MKQLKKILFVGMMCLALLIGIQTLSQATPLQIYLWDGTNPAVFVTDGGGTDTNPLDGVVSWSGPIGNWIANVTTAMTYPVLGTPATPQLDLNSINATSSSGGTLYVGASALDYTYPGGAGTLLMGGTTPGGVLAWAYSGNNVYWDNTNSINGTLSFLTGAFSGSMSGPIPALPNPYSLTIYTQIYHASAGATSFDANLSTVPEPATMLLLGSGLIGLAAYGRKKFFKK